MIVVVTSFSNREDAERVSNILVVEHIAAGAYRTTPARRHLSSGLAE